VSATVREAADLADKVASAQYLTFKIAGETYAVSILRVREILQYETVTKVPATPRSIRGVMNLRGSVVPVVDLAVKLGLPESTLTPRTCVVILEVTNEEERMVMGVMADTVSEVIELRAEDVEPPPPFGSRVKVDYLVGMGKADKKFLLVLNIDKVLSAEDLEVASRVGDELSEAASVKADVAPAEATPTVEAETPSTPVPVAAVPVEDGASTNAGEAAKARKKKASARRDEAADGHEPSRPDSA
jgi:purine-binding chemotaxis protein CheW